jgi:Phosphotransferase enzyme family
MDGSKSRIARLVLVAPGGELVGSLPGVPVATPWWQDVQPVVQAVRQRYGISVTVLRLLEAEFDSPPGGWVTYLCEVDEAAPAESWGGMLDDHPLRNPFARPGGPAADLAWAESVLKERGLEPAGRPVQVRTWNLSSLWRISVEAQTVWLKVVPPFFAHEGDLLARLAGERVPMLIGHDGARILLAEIAGEDLYNAELPQLLDMVTLLVDLQYSWAGRSEELLALGLPDWRAQALSVSIASAVGRTASELSMDDRAILARFVDNLPDRFAALAACGLPDTLVHGDFSPGNFRGDRHALTLLDWGDSGVGHPLLDQAAFFDRIHRSAHAAVREHWLSRWRSAMPAADPARACILLEPIAAARQAVIYLRFLDGIEPAEHPYHRSDPAEWLRRTVRLLAGPGGPS